MEEQIIFDTKHGTMIIEKDVFAAHDAIQIQCSTAMRISIPVGRHIRSLVELYGYEKIKNLIDDYPASLIQSGVKDAT